MLFILNEAKRYAHCLIGDRLKYGFMYSFLQFQCLLNEFGITGKEYFNPLHFKLSFMVLKTNCEMTVIHNLVTKAK